MWDSFISVCILFFEQTKTWSLAVMKITCHNSFPNSVASFSKIKYKPLLQLNINATASMSDPEWRDLPGVRCWWNDSAGVEMRDAGSPGLMRRRRRRRCRGGTARTFSKTVVGISPVNDDCGWGSMKMGGNMRSTFARSHSRLATREGVPVWRWYSVGVGEGGWGAVLPINA